MTKAEKRKLCEVAVTLDGQRAVVSGVGCDFATVSQLPNGQSYEWAWETVKHIVEKGGYFKS